MIRPLIERLRQGHHTNRFPVEVPTLPDRLRARPTVDASRCKTGCHACVDVCPTHAIELGVVEGRTVPRVDLGKCLFCPECEAACPQKVFSFGTGEYRLATRSREALVTAPGALYGVAGSLQGEALRLFGRSLKLRVVSAAGCNACEVDVNVLNTLAWDLGRFGISYVASPRHADGMLVCGPVSTSMELAVKKTWEAIPTPRICIAVGACAISGGPYSDRPEQLGGIGALVPVDLYIPGCPPHPLTILDGLLRLIGRGP